MIKVSFLMDLRIIGANKKSIIFNVRNRKHYPDGVIVFDMQAESHCGHNLTLGSKTVYQWHL